MWYSLSFTPTPSTQARTNTGTCHTPLKGLASAIWYLQKQTSGSSPLPLATGTLSDKKVSPAAGPDLWIYWVSQPGPSSSQLSYPWSFQCYRHSNIWLIGFLSYLLADGVWSLSMISPTWAFNLLHTMQVLQPVQVLAAEMPGPVVLLQLLYAPRHMQNREPLTQKNTQKWGLMRNQGRLHRSGVGNSQASVFTHFVPLPLYFPTLLHPLLCL